MKWIPPILQPFDAIMAVLLFLWFMAFSLVLHRVTRYFVQYRQTRSWPRMIEATARSLRHGGQAASADPTIRRLCDLIRKNPRPEVLDDFYNDYVSPLREPDQWNDRWLQGLAQVAPLFGLVGTVAGLLTGFMNLAAAAGAVTLRELAGPVSSALMTTYHGALCAGVCIAIRTAFAAAGLHAEQDRLLDMAGKKFTALLHPRGDEDPKSGT